MRIAAVLTLMIIAMLAASAQTNATVPAAPLAQATLG